MVIQTKIKNFDMLSTEARPNSLLRMYAKKIAVAAVTIAITFFAWGNLFCHANINANAATLEGIGNQIEGKVQKDIGTKRSAVGDLTGNYSEEVAGELQKAKGKAKQDIGTTKNKLDDAKDTVEDKSENLIDSVKDIFN